MGVPEKSNYLSLNISSITPSLLTNFCLVSKALLASQQPSYERRHNQIESLFLSAVDIMGNQYSPENLQVRINISLRPLDVRFPELAVS